jgi:hypothetical protein
MTLAIWSVITLLFVAIVDAAVVLVRRIVKPGELRQYHEVTNPLLAVVGTLFAILLGFMVASAMARYDAARNNIQSEAGAVGDIFRLARSLPEPAKSKILSDCLKYTQVVIDEEWKMMEERKTSTTAWNAYGDIWTDGSGFEPKTQKEANVHQIILETLTRLGDGRRTRAAQLHYFLPMPLWTVIFVGATAIISFTLFFDIDSLKFQVAMESIVVIVLSLNMYLLAAFDDPFSGDVCLSSAPFEVNRTMFNSILAKDWH